MRICGRRKVTGVHWNPEGPVCSLHLDFERDSVQASAEGVATIRSFMWGPGLSLTRVSNLITTRSDSFTCYIDVQGWRGAGTSADWRGVSPRAVELLPDTEPSGGPK